MLDKWEDVCVLGLAGAGRTVIVPGTRLMVTGQPSVCREVLFTNQHRIACKSLSAAESMWRRRKVSVQPYSYRKGVVRAAWKLPAKIWKHVKVKMLSFTHLTGEQILAICSERKEGIICLKLWGNGRVPLHVHRCFLDRMWPIHILAYSSAYLWAFFGAT